MKIKNAKNQGKLWTLYTQKMYLTQEPGRNISSNVQKVGFYEPGSNGTWNVSSMKSDICSKLKTLRSYSGKKRGKKRGKKQKQKVN
jgi:hypothetical protein